MFYVTQTRNQPYQPGTYTCPSISLSLSLLAQSSLSLFLSRSFSLWSVFLPLSGCPRGGNEFCVLLMFLVCFLLRVVLLNDRTPYPVSDKAKKLIETKYKKPCINMGKTLTCPPSSLSLSLSLNLSLNLSLSLSSCNLPSLAFLFSYLSLIVCVSSLICVIFSSY